MSLYGELVDLQTFREQRAAEKQQRREAKRCNLSVMAPDYGREIPPRINPHVFDMVDQVQSCYVALIQAVEVFKQQVADLVAAGELAPSERLSLQGHYRELVDAIDVATEATLRWRASGVPPGVITEQAHHIADHAKYVYVVGSRDIAAMQYWLAELAHTGRLTHCANERLQWGHCCKFWDSLYLGTVCAVRDERTWDGGWDWSDNTFSDGRQIMSQVRVNNWHAVDHEWPHNAYLAGDGPIQEHPVGSVCSIAPVVDPEPDRVQRHVPLEIDLEALVEQVGKKRLIPADADISASEKQMPG